MIRAHYWLYTENEMTALMDGLSRLLEVEKFDHDIENTWEYMDGFSRRFNAEINVSREKEHKERPFHIGVHFRRHAANDTRDEIGNKLTQHFRLPVFYGTMREQEGYKDGTTFKYEHIVMKRYH